MFNFFSNGINLFARFSVNKHKFTSNFDCRTVEFTLDSSDSLFFVVITLAGSKTAYAEFSLKKRCLAVFLFPFMEYRFDDCRNHSERKNRDFNNQTYKRREQGHKNHKQQNQKQSAENDLQ